MEYLIFSDVHGNLPALENVLSYTNQTDYTICLGDVVNYGPWSNECVMLLNEIKNITIIKGNHEDYFLNNKCESENILVRHFFDKCIINFDQYNLLESYKDEYKLDNYKCLHTVNNKYIYNDTKFLLDDNYIIGHNHTQFEIIQDNYKLISVGSVGQNRKNFKKSEFIIYDSNSKEINFLSIDYNYEHFIKELEIRQYPIECINYYKSKL